MTGPRYHFGNQTQKHTLVASHNMSLAQATQKLN